MEENSIIAHLYGTDKPGLVAKSTQWIFNRGGNILHADQHRYAYENIFCQRLEWAYKREIDILEEMRLFEEMAKKELHSNVKTFSKNDKTKIALFVSKFDHCFHDIIARWKNNEFYGEIACVISNHEDLREASENYNLPYYYTPIHEAIRSEGEKKHLEICDEHGIQLVILARYMQILSASFLSKIRCPIINIHHSFLPAFLGAKPYHQAYERGVKLIGATAHYATEKLDEGPIIHQDVTPISHRHSVADLICKGRDLEKMVLGQAIRWHLEHRVLIYGNKTVVFD